MLSQLNEYFTAGEMEFFRANVINTITKETGKPRHYHSIENHINPMIVDIVKNEPPCNNTKLLLLAALYHDAVYNPKGKLNEELSAEMWELDAKEITLNEEEIKTVKQLILDTKSHIPSSELSKTFICYDLKGFTRSFKNVLDDELLIRKEYAFADWDLYKTERIKILDKFSKSSIINSTLGIRAYNNLIAQIDYLKFHTPKIAVYPGSFDPFHKGHADILKKGESIFDKVIVLYANNPDKNYSNRVVPEFLKYHQVDNHAGGMVDYLFGKNYPLTIIRGLRNTTDFSEEQNYTKWLSELFKEKRSEVEKSDSVNLARRLNIINIFCDKSYEHISSSDLKRVKNLSEKKYRDYLVK